MIHRIQPGIVLPIVLIATTCAGVLLLHAALGLYVYPAADDFCMVSGVEQMGFFAYLKQHYIEWSGRYTGNALYGLYPLLFGLFEGYAWLGLLQILAFLAAFAFALASLFDLRMSHPRVVLSSLLLVALYLLGLRHTASSLYWMAGALSYQSANILLLLIVGSAVRFLRAPRSRVLPICIGVLLVLAMGSNETSMIVLLLVTALILLLVYRRQAGGRSASLALMVLAVGCFLLVFLAPGNAERASTFPLRHDLLRSIDGSLRMGGWTLMVWLTQPVFIVGSLLIAFAAQFLERQSAVALTPGSKTLVLLAAMTLVFPFLLQFPAWWSMGGWPPPRTVDAIFFVFFLCWTLLVGGLSLRFMPAGVTAAGNGGVNRLMLPALWGLALLFVISVGLNLRLQRAWTDLTQHAPGFAQYMQQRHALIQRSLDNRVYSLEVPAYPGELPRSIFFNDIRPDWRDWRNACYARHFGLGAIQRETRTQPSTPHDQGEM